MNGTNNSNSPDNKDQNKRTDLKFPKGFVNFIVLGIILFLIFLMFQAGDSSKEISWTKFEDLVSDKKVERVVVVNKETAEVYLEKDTDRQEDIYFPVAGGPDYYFNIGSPEVFEEKLYRVQKGFSEQEEVDVEYATEENWFWAIMIWVIPFFLLFLLWRWARRSMSRGGGSSLFSFAQSRAKLFEHDEKVDITFQNVAGLDEAKEEMEETVDFLKHPEHYTKLGAKIPKGVLLVGPPGTGKTLLAKAVAGEANVPFFSLSGSEFVEMFVGVGASRVRDLFKKAKEKAPCIIFIDELDAIGRSRGKSQTMGANDERESTLNQLLTEMDGFNPNSGVIVLAATNRGEILDQALLRPGRFDRNIYLELPDMNGRKEIFAVHLKPLKVDDTVDVNFLAAQTPGFSGADIANACNEAALLAARRKKSFVGKQEFSDALDRIIGGLEKKKKVIVADERRIIAIHESGHALATCYLKGLKGIVKVSIIPRGRSLGATWNKPEELQLHTLSHLKKQMSIILAGRAAEEIIFGEVTSGALDDLERVTKQAYSMITYYGLSDKIGNISYYDSSGNESSFQKPYSEQTAREIDEEVRKLVSECYENVKKLLTEHKEALIKTGELLLEKEVIFRDDLEKVMKEQVRVHH